VVPRKYLSRVHVNQEGLKTNKPNFGVKKKNRLIFNCTIKFNIFFNNILNPDIQ
jgi:hypothetical protein